MELRMIQGRQKSSKLRRVRGRPLEWPYYTDSTKRKPFLYANISNEMLEFSYHFGHETMVEQSTQAYQAQMMRTHRTRPWKTGVRSWKDEKGQSWGKLSCRKDEKGEKKGSRPTEARGIENWGTTSESTNEVQELILKRANQNRWVKNADSFLF